MTNEWHCVEKPWGYHGEWRFHCRKTYGACGPSGFWPWDLPWDSIHHDTPSAFPHIIPTCDICVDVCFVLLISSAKVWPYVNRRKKKITINNSNTPRQPDAALGISRRYLFILINNCLFYYKYNSLDYTLYYKHRTVTTTNSHYTLYCA